MTLTSLLFRASANSHNFQIKEQISNKLNWNNNSSNKTNFNNLLPFYVVQDLKW